MGDLHNKEVLELIEGTEEAAKGIDSPCALIETIKSWVRWLGHEKKEKTRTELSLVINIYLKRLREITEIMGGEQ